MVKSTYCSCRGPRFCSQQVPLTPVPRDPQIPFPGLWGFLQACCAAHKLPQAYTHAHNQKNKNKLIFKKKKKTDFSSRKGKLCIYQTGRKLRRQHSGRKGRGECNWCSLGPLTKKAKKAPQPEARCTMAGWMWRLGREELAGGGARKSTAVSPCGVIVLLGSELVGTYGTEGPQHRMNAPSGQGQSFRNEGNGPISGYPSSSVIFPWAGERRS